MVVFFEAQPGVQLVGRPAESPQNGSSQTPRPLREEGHGFRHLGATSRTGQPDRRLAAPTLRLT